MQPLTEELREGMDYKGAGGVLISGIVRDGPADRAGVRKGDVVVRADAHTVDSPSALQEIVRGGRVGQHLALEVVRDGQHRTISVGLGERPSDEEMTAPEPPEPAEPAPPAEPAEPSAPPDLGSGHGTLREFDLPGGGLARILTTPSRGRLGVRIESLSPELGSYFSVRDGKGVLVLEVMKDTPAERAGLKAGDVITRVGERAVADAEDLVNVLRGREGEVSLRVVRHGTPRTIEATLEKPESDWGSGTRREIRVQVPDRGQSGTDRGDVQRELEQLRRQLERLQQRLDRMQGSDRGND